MNVSKSQLWQQIKTIGNPNGLKWQTKYEEMEASLQNHYLRQELNIFQDYEPYFLPIVQQSDQDEEQKEQIPLVLLSTLLYKEMRTLTLEDFPVEWGYEDSDGEHRYRALSLRSLENQIESLKNASSDFLDVEIDESTFSFIKEHQYVYIPREKRVQKSKKGQGNDFQQCDIIDNEYIFCPRSGRCLLDCLYHVKPIDEETHKQIEKFIKDKKIFRYNIPACNVRDICEIIGLTFNIYSKTRQCLQYKYEEGQIILCLINSHWIILKQKNSLQECYNYAVQNIVWKDKRIDECSFQTQMQTSKYHECKDDDAYQDTYIYDFEAYPQQINKQFIPYACGVACLDDLNRYIEGKSNLASPQCYVRIFDGEDCAYQLLQYIDRITKKVKKQVTDKKSGKTLNIYQKRDIFLYAHNGANYDTYKFLGLNNPEIKFSKMIEKGGIMQLEIEGFKNANFIIKDTRKFLVQSLKKLCESFKLDEGVCKSEFDHTKVNALNWKSLQPEWSPYLKNDVVSLSLIWIKFIGKMRMISKDLDVKKYVSIAQMSYSICMKDQQLPAFTCPLLRQFIQQANRGGRVIARNQRYQTKNIQQILDLNGVQNIDQLVGKPLDPQTKNLVGQDFGICFDATSLYPSAMQLEHSCYLDAEKTTFLTSEQCKNFNPNEWKDKKFIIECDLFAPQDLQFVPLSIRTNFGAQFSTGSIKRVKVYDVDLYECLRYGYKLICVHQGIYSPPIQYTFLRDFVLKFYSERAKVKNTDTVLGDLYKLILNSCYGKFAQKTIEQETKFTTKKEMERESLYTNDVSEIIELNNGQVCYKVKKEQKEGQRLSPHHIGGYILAYSKQIMNNFVLTLGADKQNIVDYMDTDSLTIHQTHYDKLKSIKDCLGGGKNDYQNKVIIQGHYLACKSKIVYLLDLEKLRLDRKVTWKGVSSGKFDEIRQTTVERLQFGDDYIADVENWNKDKKNGVSIQSGCSKKLSISEYCQKYDLIGNTYHFKHLE